MLGTREHLKFLYLTHPLVSSSTTNIANILVANEKREMCHPHQTNIYLPDDYEFGAKKLVGDDEEGSEPQGRPNLKFIHHWYLEDIPDKPNDFIFS